MTKVPTIEQMLKAGMHFGHRTSKWHPKCKPFIFEARNGVHIIDLMKAQKMLGEALDFMRKMSAEGKTIMIIGTKMQAKDLIEKIAVETDMPYVKEKWMGGALTNFPVIKKVIKKYNDMLRDKETGRLEKYTKKERLEMDRDLGRLKLKVGGLTKVTRLPDALFVWDVSREKTAITEARKKNIPIVAVCDTGSDPSGINYVIPSNDDATKTVKLLLNTVKDAIMEGKKDRENAVHASPAVEEKVEAKK